MIVTRVMNLPKNKTEKLETDMRILLILVTLLVLPTLLRVLFEKPASSQTRKASEA